MGWFDTPECYWGNRGPTMRFLSSLIKGSRNGLKRMCLLDWVDSAHMKINEDTPAFPASEIVFPSEKLKGTGPSKRVETVPTWHMRFGGFIG